MEAGTDLSALIRAPTGAPQPWVKIKRDATIVPAILAPQRTVLANADAFTANLYRGRAKLKGVQISEPLLCP